MNILMTKATDGPLAGFMTLAVTAAQKQTMVEKMRATVADCRARHVTYLMGGKPNQLAASPLDVSGIDCSGFFRYLLFHMTLAALGSGFVVPDGSGNQNDWCAGRGFKHGDHDHYLAVAGLQDNILRAAFCRSEDGHPYGHVWLVLNGVTYESHADIGPSSRAWDAPVLDRIVSDVYCLC